MVMRPVRALYRRIYWWPTDRRLLRPFRGIRTVVAFGESLGDNLLCANILAGLEARGEGPLAILTPFADLFSHLPFPVLCRPFEPAVIAALRRSGPRLVMPAYVKYDPATDRLYPPPSDHLIVGLARSAGLSGRIELKPRLDLTPAERAAGAVRAANHILIQSSNLRAHLPSANKDWPLDRWQTVVDRLSTLHPVAQIGSSDDPLLRGVTDWRGCSVRTTASLLSAARLYLGGEGAVMHLARAVDCRAVIVLGGRTKPEQTCYPEYTNLYTPMSCSPCWQFNACDSQRACLLAITPDDVVAAARTQLDLAPLTGPAKFVAL